MTEEYPREWATAYPFPLYAITIQKYDRQPLDEEGVHILLTPSEFRYLREFIATGEKSIGTTLAYPYQQVKSLYLSHEDGMVRFVAYDMDTVMEELCFVFDVIKTDGKPTYEPKPASPVANSALPKDLWAWYLDSMDRRLKEESQ